MIVYPNLESAMQRSGIRKSDLSMLLNCDPKSLWNKLNGRSEFTINEAFLIRDTYFPNLSIEYLFRRKQDGERLSDR